MTHFGHHRTTLSGYIFATKACIDSRKNSLNGNMSSICPQNILNFSLLTAEICWRVWGTPANFNASLLQRRRSTEVDQRLHYVRPYPGLVYCIYVFGSSCPLTEFCHVQNSLCVHCPATNHRTSLSGYTFGTKACIDNWKKPVKQ